MTDDASFHSCCEDLRPTNGQQRQPHHHHHRHGVDNACCCYSSDTDDEAQFLTASNSPLSLEASYSSAAGCYGPGGAGGAQHQADAADFVACLAGDLERTLGGESCQSQSPSSPMIGGSETADDGRIVVASSTVTAGAARSTRPLDYSGINTAEDCNPDDADEFPPPLASSSSASLAGLSKLHQQQMPGAPTMTLSRPQDLIAAAKRTQAATNETAVCGDADNTAIAAGFLPQLADTDSHLDVATPAGARNLHYCYLDNDLTAHRPQARRTRSGPTTLRQKFGSAQELLWLSSHRYRDRDDADDNGGSNGDPQRPMPQPAPPPPTAQKLKTRPSDAARDSLDFPARLRKRVRFADALGFDLASVVLIAGAAAARSNFEFGAQFLSDEDLLLDFQASAAAADVQGMFSGFGQSGDTAAENSELNRGRIFATETESLLQSCSPMSPSTVAQQSLLHQSEDPNWTSITPWDPAQTAGPGRPIALESVRFFSEPSQILELTARVLNIAPEKRVMARVTFDNWRHQSDWSLRYCQTLADCHPGGQERFRARLHVPAGAAAFELALSYSADGQVHWDNNAGRNYMYVYKACQ
ncbi:hypothetical protein BOX15_Mlig019096g2 [Macrostomum lignano]|uniref:Uncharacterized protein n=2 Tax=Macrostomum lignano TaxID=282301 RepID=A0A267G001_9PLAT|nr:hypothetical protein BOX15_Mlig019096g2 [Macrostomum lignano]